MQIKRGKTEFVALMSFLIGVTLVVSNGFSARIFAQEEERAVFEQIAPIGNVLAEIIKNYVHEPDVEKAVEGALMGIMNSLDRNSSYIPARGFKRMQEETEGEFDGIGVHIKYDDSEEQRILVWQPIPDAPAARAGLRSGDIIDEIDGVSTLGMDLGEAARRIKGPRGREVHLAILRSVGEEDEPERLEFDVIRGKIPLKSIVEARILDGGVGYIRLSDFKKNTAADVKKQLEAFKTEASLKAFVLDLRWNPGGLLSASREVSDLFLPKNTLVTSTKGRNKDEGGRGEEVKLLTEKAAVLPETMPLIVLVGRLTASSSEIVTGALQYHRRALIIGEKTFGKGSVQTIIPLGSPKGSALRLTTALYYTPGDVTIDRAGIIPDVAVEMDKEMQDDLRIQMIVSFEDDSALSNQQNHGRVTGDLVTEETVNDLVLERAMEILREDPVFENLLAKYHKDPRETQVAAAEEAEDAGDPRGPHPARLVPSDHPK